MMIRSLSSVCIIAEAGVNHNGLLDQVKEMADFDKKSLFFSPPKLDCTIKSHKSIVPAKDFAPGTKFPPENITTKRPGLGISPLYYWELLGKSAPRNYSKDKPIDPGDLGNP